jgi:hypothetical protein
MVTKTKPQNRKWLTTVRIVFPEARHPVSDVVWQLSAEPTDHYLRNFQWDKVRYRADRPLGELIGNLQKELQNIDNDVKAKFNQYSGIKTTLAALQRKQT